MAPETEEFYKNCLESFYKDCLETFVARWRSTSPCVPLDENTILAAGKLTARIREHEMMLNIILRGEAYADDTGTLVIT